MQDEFERRILLRQEIKSLIIVATFQNEQGSHFIGFDDCVNIRDFSLDEVETISTCLNIVGVFLTRLRTHQKEQKVYQTTKKAINCYGLF